MVRLDAQLLGQLAVPQYSYPIRQPFGQPNFAQCLRIDRRAVLKGQVQVADVHDEERLVPRGVAKPALGNAPKELHLAAFEELRRLLGARAGPLPLGAARRSFPMTAADAPADALLLANLVDADMYRGQVH